MNQTIERTALSQLVANEEYARKVLPHMKEEYFSDRIERTLFSQIIKFVEKEPEPTLTCDRIAGCEVFPNAITEEEYCPTCVVK